MGSAAAAVAAAVAAVAVAAAVGVAARAEVHTVGRMSARVRSCTWRREETNQRDLPLALQHMVERMQYLSYPVCKADRNRIRAARHFHRLAEIARRIGNWLQENTPDSTRASAPT